MLVRSSNVVKKHLENTALSNTDVNNTTTSTIGTTDSSNGSNSSQLIDDKKESPEAAAERVKCKYTRYKIQRKSSFTVLVLYIFVFISYVHSAW